MGLLSLELNVREGVGGGRLRMATVTIFCTDGCFSTCLSYNAANDIERGKTTF